MTAKTWQEHLDWLLETTEYGDHLRPFLHYNYDLRSGTPDDIVTGQMDVDHGCFHDDGFVCVHRLKVIKDELGRFIDV